jgi:hypothetical protein
VNVSEWWLRWQNNFLLRPALAVVAFPSLLQVTLIEKIEM